MNLGVMIEGQEGLDWDRWRRIVTTTEELGFESLWRSDHFQSLGGPTDRNALETFISFVMVAELTERIRFGPLVASMTFRHPSLLGRMAAQLDVLSGGRFICGMGAGWNVPEHETFGLPFPGTGERMDRLDESIRVVRTLWGEGPASFDGKHYQLEDVDCHPKPLQDPMPILVGGSGEKRTLRIVAEHAQEWNFVGGGLDVYAQKREVLERHCADAGRDPSEIAHSQMAAIIVGRDDAELKAHLAEIAVAVPRLGQRDPDETLKNMRGFGWLVGSPAEIVEEIGRREEAGISRIMMQHHAQTRFEALELIASDVLPQVQG